MVYPWIVNARHNKLCYCCCCCCCSIAKNKEMIEWLFAVLFPDGQMALDVILVVGPRGFFFKFKQTMLLFHGSLCYQILTRLAYVHMINIKKKNARSSYTRTSRTLNLEFFLPSLYSYFLYVVKTTLDI